MIALPQRGIDARDAEMKRRAGVDGLTAAERPDETSIEAKLMRLTAHDPGRDWTQVTS